MTDLLTKHSIVSSLPPARGSLKDDVLDRLLDEISDAVEMRDIFEELGLVTDDADDAGAAHQ